MLRTLLAVLIAANLLFFAFTRGWFDGEFVSSLGDREPERLNEQLRPESVRILPTASAASSAANAAATAVTCYEAGPFEAADALAAEAVLRAALPAGSWTDDRIELAADGSGRAPGLAHLYRMNKVDAALASRLAGLRFEPGGRAFRPCTKAEPAR